MKLISWNVNGFSHTEPEVAGKLEALVGRDADVIALQEISLDGGDSEVRVSKLARCVERHAFPCQSPLDLPCPREQRGPPAPLRFAA